MKKLLSLLPMLLILHFAHAQYFQRLNAPVTKNGQLLPNAWAGGLNGPQWSGVDLNNDGKQDLYAFDRSGDKHLTFLNIGGTGETKYEFAPQYAENFPTCLNFVLLRDYNQDGIMDLFACSKEEGASGLKVYRGRFEGNEIKFTRVYFPWAISVLLIEVNNATTQLPVNSTDYPAIDDIDGDGDLDVVAMNISGGNATFYRNISLEQGLPLDSLVFEQADDCWGGFYIPFFTPSMDLSSGPGDCASFKGPDDSDVKNGLHGGAALCTYDADNDGDKELLYGDLIYPNTILGINCGDEEQAWFCEQDANFPSLDVSIDVADFPSCFYLDADNDGKKDLLVSPNIAFTGLDENVVWFYKNTQTNQIPKFELQTEYLVVDGMIDHGTITNPAFVDFNADGLLDFVLGNETVYQPSGIGKSKMVLYKNVGTPTAPAFVVEDEDWLSFSEFIDNNVQPFGYAPAFGDLDGDGDLDLLVGERSGRFFYGENIAGAGNPLEFAPIIPYWQDLAVGAFIVPCIHDINKDGLGDIVAGVYQGNIIYMPNIGTVGNPMFHPNPSEAPNNNYFGQISTLDIGLTVGLAAPEILESPDGTMYLVTGTYKGYLKYYKIIPENIDVHGAPFELLDAKLGLLREGTATTVAFGNLNGDDYLDCIVGNQRGGVGLFSSPILLDGSISATQTICPSLAAEIYPNPAFDYLVVDLETEGSPACQYRLHNALGQFLGNGKLLPGEKRIDVGHLAKGIYFLELVLGNSRVTKRFVKG